MMKQQIEQWVELVLNNTPAAQPESFSVTPYEHFLLNCGKRLVNAFKRYQLDYQFLGDFLIALRNYLLTFQTEIHLPYEIVSDTLDLYGLWADSETGIVRASYQLPDYVNPSFVQTAFLSEDYSTQIHRNDNHINLSTDPMVYHLTGYSRFRSLAQKIAFYGAMKTPDGYTTLISIPTGGGKSLITQAVSYQKDGLTIIIVPTVSLAIDQVRVAKKTIQYGNPEEEVFYYSSGINVTPILDAIKQKKARMLFISPEALIQNSSFVAAIDEANKSRFLKNIIIDEAHIVVDWGTDFRIDYQCLESWRKKLIKHNPQIRTILLSATFERRCRDILKDFFSEGDNWIEIRCDALRHEPRFALIQCNSKYEKGRRIIELVRKCPHPMIVYVARPIEAERIKDLLQSNGINNVNTFTGLTTNAKRQELIRSWVNDEFDVMIATSAFGVGVDKPDIRTVLHAYVPPNPNAYYQELGRGGRDQLPCLSIMCMIDDDLQTSFQRINKKVMTAEKVIKRWDSMYNNEQSVRIDNRVMIDTTIKPNYSVEDEFDDSPTSEADIRWNVYVLLLLRRYKKIRIDEVLAHSGGYTFVIEILDDLLRTKDGLLETEMETIRTEEWAYYKASFDLMNKSIRRNGKDCWSEMFFETYDKVFEYCAGCANHNRPNIGDSAKFCLKTPIEAPKYDLSADQLSMFGESKHLIVRCIPEKTIDTLRDLSNRRLTGLIVPKSWDSSPFFSDPKNNIGLLIMDTMELHELIKKKSWYYISGVFAVLYQGTDHDIYEQLLTVTNELGSIPWVRIVHIISKDIYFNWINKSFSDFLDGRQIFAEAITTI